jgi:segregation and condensation protein A
MHEVKLEQFTGPLGLLLRLIEKEELDITELSLAKIADNYVDYIQANKNIPDEELADFLVLAARLLYIKSKALLPYLVFDDPEDNEDDLERQLKMYQEFVTASEVLAVLIGRKKFLFAPSALNRNWRRRQIVKPKFVAPKNLTAELLAARYEEILDRLAATVKFLPEESLEAKISIDERIISIRNLLGKQLRFSFSKFLKTAKNRTEVVVNFLAVLELAKQHELVFEQDGLFTEIQIVAIKQ